MKETISQNYSENWFSIINLIQKSKPNLKKLFSSPISAVHDEHFPLPLAMNRTLYHII